MASRNTQATVKTPEIVVKGFHDGRGVYLTEKRDRPILTTPLLPIGSNALVGIIEGICETECGRQRLTEILGVVLASALKQGVLPEDQAERQAIVGLIHCYAEQMKSFVVKGLDRA